MRNEVLGAVAEMDFQDAVDNNKEILEEEFDLACMKKRREAYLARKAE